VVFLVKRDLCGKGWTDLPVYVCPHVPMIKPQLASFGGEPLGGEKWSPMMGLFPEKRKRE
jgi:hypothetical protein